MDLINKNSFIYILLLLITFPACIFAQKEIVFSGYGAAGYKIFDRNKLRKYNQEVYYEGKLQADVKINKHIDAQLDLRGSSEDQAVILREFSVKLDYLKYLRFKLGNIKKPFGLEQLVNTEELPTIERSYIQRTISGFGYGGRGVSLAAYYNYNKKRPEFPFSYALALTRDNSLNSSVAARLSFHQQEIIYSGNFLFQHTGGEFPNNAEGFSFDISYAANSFTTSLEALYVQDPVESLKLKLSGNERSVFSSGIKSLSTYAFNIDGEVVKTIEPVILAALFLPDSRQSSYHTIEVNAGTNIYLDKDLRFRLNGDLLLTRNRFNTRYSTIDSGIIFECQVRF